MSRQTSPGPSHLNVQSVMYQSPATLAAYQQKQPRQKPYVAGITAGVEDVKYQAKYKELKKKVREIETDNDRLYFKLLLAKKNIRRMNLERAILYERLAAVPPTPGRHPQELPPVEDPLFHPQAPLPPESMIDPNDHALVEYMRAHPHARLVQAPDGRVVAVEDTPATIPHSAVNTIIPQAPPHELPLVHSFRHDSGPGYDADRQLPPLPPMVPGARAPESQDIEHHAHPYAPAQHPHAQQHSNNSHRAPATRGGPATDLDVHGDRRRAVHPVATHPPLEVEGMPPRMDAPVIVHPIHRSPGAPPAPIPMSPPHSAPSPTSTRGSGGGGGNSRIHNHQRVGPGANINRELTERELEEQRERRLEREREREMEREIERQRLEREMAYQSRMDVDEHEDAAAGGQWRTDAPLVGPGMSHGASRAGTPNGGAGNMGPSRSASDQAYEYDRERERPLSYGPRAYEDHEDRAARMPPADMGPAPLDSRKRSRSELETGEEYSGEIRSPIDSGTSRSGNTPPDSRASKRMHPGDDERGSGEREDQPMDEEP